MILKKEKSETCRRASAKQGTWGSNHSLSLVSIELGRKKILSVRVQAAKE
jgi:hypothetical protein